MKIFAIRSLFNVILYLAHLNRQERQEHCLPQQGYFDVTRRLHCIILHCSYVAGYLFATTGIKEASSNLHAQFPRSRELPMSVFHS